MQEGIISKCIAEGRRERNPPSCTPSQASRVFLLTWRPVCNGSACLNPTHLARDLGDLLVHILLLSILMMQLILHHHQTLIPTNFYSKEMQLNPKEGLRFVSLVNCTWLPICHTPIPQYLLSFLESLSKFSRGDWDPRDTEPLPCFMIPVHLRGEKPAQEQGLSQLRNIPPAHRITES